MTTSDQTFGLDLSAAAGRTLFAVLALGFAAAYGLGVSELVSAGPDARFRPVLLTILVPLVAAVATYLASARLRYFVLGLDLRVLTLLQAWRVLGFAFLPLYAYDVLPGLFAWPAGLGDVAVGLAAPFVVARLVREPAFAASRGFLAFHLLGLVDFLVAAVTSSLASGAFPAIFTGTPTSAAMETWPLILFPAFIVPVFIVLHLAVLLRLFSRSPAHRAAAAPA